VSGSTSWWDDFTVARNYLVATAPELVYPDDGDEDVWENNTVESRNPLLVKNSVMRNEIERLCVANLPGKEDKIQKEKKNKKAVNLVTRNNPNSYVSFV
jgi:alpha-glucosidase (family GH31 glycosyl hydrolase)